MKPIFSYRQWLITYKAFYYCGRGKNNTHNSYVGEIPPQNILVVGSSLYVLFCNGSFSDETSLFLHKTITLYVKTINTATLTIAIFEVIMMLAL